MKKKIIDQDIIEFWGGQGNKLDLTVFNGFDNISMDIEDGHIRFYGDRLETDEEYNKRISKQKKNKEVYREKIRKQAIKLGLIPQ